MDYKQKQAINKINPVTSGPNEIGGLSLNISPSVQIDLTPKAGQCKQAIQPFNASTGYRTNTNSGEKVSLLNNDYRLLNNMDGEITSFEHNDH